MTDYICLWCSEEFETNSNEKIVRCPDCLRWMAMTPEAKQEFIIDIEQVREAEDELATWNQKLLELL